MTREEFKSILEANMYYFYKTEGDKIIITTNGDVNLYSLTSLPSGVEFRNGRNVQLSSLNSIPVGVEFKNEGFIYLGSLIGGWVSNWKGNIKGIDSQRLLNKMIELGLFDKEKK
jgi:hypothetical protein